MIGQLTDIQQRRLAIAILCGIVVAFMAITVVPAWTTGAAYSAQINQMQARLQRFETQAAADDALRPRYEQLARSHASSAHYLKSDTEAVAAAELQRVVKAITASNATQILTTQILPTAEEEGFIRVALRVRVRGSLEGIVQSIYDIEANQTFLFLDNLSIRDGARRRIRGTDQVNQFDGDFDLIAYMPKSIS
jgi:general secretion pathway protein M